uniref:RRM domain-containing protein n=1 Tax=Heterosigma akashiwo TaxID=2829 RepID=A0A6V1NUL1_HETAK|mmetsp:Transcript_20827/g.33701  ORF Transcript_20827/g.33701 Transcript_20827/m.33701 type:complete len:235 (+) Transcript_20827:51-755(+)
MAATMDKPLETIYINNLNEKIKKDVLKKSLHSIFSQFGKIIEIVACRGLKLRGQAWVCFADTAAATNALRQMQGFPFYEKPMRIAFAKNKSDKVLKREGVYDPAKKRRKMEERKKAAAEKAAAESVAAMEQEPTPAAVVQPAFTAVQQVEQPVPANVPHRILFAQNLPDDCNEMMLDMLFQQYNGYKEVRMVPGKKGLAFIEFGDEMQAGYALQGLNGFKLTPQDLLQLSYARK